MKYLEVEKQGQLLKVKLLRPADYRQQSPALRGIISQFSAKSRKRLIETFTRLDTKKMKYSKERVKFITLTYQDNMQNYELSKLHLKRFIERLQYRFDDFWCVWKMELQERGAVHFHLIAGGMPYLDMYYLQVMWAICSDQTPDNMTMVESLESLAKRCPFTRIEAIKSVRGVLSYAAKYMTKLEDGKTGETVHATALSSAKRVADENGLIGLTICHTFGRFWGVYGRQNIPFADKINVMCALTDKMYNWFLSIVDSPYVNVEQGWAVYGEHVDRLYKALGTLYLSDDSLELMLAGFLVQKARIENEPMRRYFNNLDMNIKIQKAKREMGLA